VERVVLEVEGGAGRVTQGGGGAVRCGIGALGPCATNGPVGIPVAIDVTPLVGVRTGIGNAVEWYDWAIYATFSPFIAGALFSNADPKSAVLATLAIFAVGFVARPFGGFVFGWIGDRIGRKTSMTFAVGLAAVGSLLIGVAPTFEAVGAFASVLLLVARLIQGLAHGGELPSSQTYLSEMAPKEKRGFWATLISPSGTAGILAGTLDPSTFRFVVHKDVDDDGIDLGMWRVPPQRLLVPVDVHIHKLARNLGLTKRATTSWKTTSARPKHTPASSASACVPSTTTIRWISVPADWAEIVCSSSDRPPRSASGFGPLRRAGARRQDQTCIQAAAS